MEVIKPKALRKGGTIGLVAPASPVSAEKLAKCQDVLRRLGYSVKPGSSVHERYGYLAGPDDRRARDLQHMFADPEVDAIFCVRGGYGTPRILDQIDYSVIQSNPKIFVGYSDITALHLAIQQRTGLVTFHGPMVAELAESPHALTWPTLWKHLQGGSAAGRYEPAGMFQFCIRGGVAEGPLIGGNLSLVAATLGTSYEIQTKGKILFLEDVGEVPYSIDRMLVQLKLAGKLQAAAGLVFTDFARVEPKRDEQSLTIRQVLEDIVKPLGIPAFYGLKAGHCQPNLTLPIGIRTRMNAAEGWLEFLESGVIREEKE